MPKQNALHVKIIVLVLPLPKVMSRQTRGPQITAMARVEASSRLAHNSNEVENVFSQRFTGRKFEVSAAALVEKAEAYNPTAFSEVLGAQEDSRP
jgi:hypothetical protein